MVLTPFHLTPLVVEVITVLVDANEPLSSKEVAERLPDRRADHIVKALSRMHTTGWLTCDSTPRAGRAAVMGYAIKDAHRDAAAVIVADPSAIKKQRRSAPQAPVPLEAQGTFIWTNKRLLIAEILLLSNEPLTPMVVAMRAEYSPGEVLETLLRLEAEQLVQADRPDKESEAYTEWTFTINPARRQMIRMRVDYWRSKILYWKPQTPPPEDHSMTKEEHEYFSTACWHESHDDCRSTTAADGNPKERGTCKFCGAKCVCDCHPWNN